MYLPSQSLVQSLRNLNRVNPNPNPNPSHIPRRKPFDLCARPRKAVSVESEDGDGGMRKGEAVVAKTRAPRKKRSDLDRDASEDADDEGEDAAFDEEHDEPESYDHLSMPAFIDFENGKFVADFDKLSPELQEESLDLDSTEPFAYPWRKRDIISNGDIDPLVIIEPYGFSVSQIDDYFSGIHTASGSVGDDLQYLERPEKNFDSSSLIEDFQLRKTEIELDDDDWTERDEEFVQWVQREVNHGTPHLFDHIEAQKKLDTMRDYPEICLELLKPDPRANYTDEILEFKSTKMLMPYWAPPAERFANDSFEPAEDKVYALKYLGTMAARYDWSPSDPTEHSIDPEIEKRMDPLLQMVGDSMKLLSTKDGFVRFRYYGLVKNLIGIQAWIKYLMPYVYPEFKDVRLETRREYDSDDIS